MDRFKVIEHYTGKDGMVPGRKLFKIKDIKNDTVGFSAYKDKECAEEICRRKNDKSKKCCG